MLELGDTEDPLQLIPGAPQRLQEFAQELSKLGDHAELTSGELARIDLSTWTGPASEAYQNFHGQEPARWQSATDAFGEVAQALVQYSKVLAWAQDMAAMALVEWQMGNKQPATQLLTEARDQAAQASMTANQVVQQAIGAAPKGPSLGQAPSANTNASSATAPMVYIDADRHPETAQHVQEAQSGTIWRGDTVTSGAPLPSVLTIDRPNASKNRAVSLRGIPTRVGQDRDEYPPAMFEEGGAGASVKYIDPADNRGAGSSMSHQIRALNLGNGQKVEIGVLNSGDEDGNTDDTDDGGREHDSGNDEDGNTADGDTGDDGDGHENEDDEGDLAAITNPLQS